MRSCARLRPSRLRAGENIRSLVRETRLAKESLVMPLFFKEGSKSERIPSMPGIAKMGSDAVLKEVEVLDKAGINAVLLFGSHGRKDSAATAAFDEDSAFHKAICRIKENSDIVVIADVCACAYTDHGHCGILKSQSHKDSAERRVASPKGTRTQVIIDNEKTLDVLAKIAVSYARSGADMVAPSAMADGQVRAIREALDRSGFSETAIMGYSAKYASAFYGPFRDIYDSSPVSGDRRSYQMDIGNSREALMEAALDVEEGADIVMVKPALAALDIIKAVKERVRVPVAAYSVSGEYSVIKAAADKGWLDEEASAMEILASIKRAGADIIITYWAKEAAAWIQRRR
jgi:porphobilinogen synthase